MDSDVLSKEPPHSDDAELAVLAGIMMRNTAMDDVRAVMQPADIYRTAHRLIFEAMTDLSDAGSPIDPVTLAERLRSKAQLEEIGGLVFIDRLMDITATSANVAHYAGIVAEKAKRRTMIAASHEVMAAAYDETEDAEKAWAAADERVSAQMAGSGDFGVTMGSAVRNILDFVDRAHGGEIVFRDTHLATVNDVARGFMPDDMVIVCARPGHGKTAFCRGWASHLARYGHVIYVQLDQSLTNFVGITLAQRAKMSWADAREGRVADHQFESLVSAAAELYRERILIVDAVTDIDVLCAKIRAYARRRDVRETGGLVAVFIDYVQLLDAQRTKSSNREQEIATVSRRLRALSKALKTMVIAVAQLNRLSAHRASKRPTDSDIRESGALEQDADFILGLYREIKDNEMVDANIANTLEALILKSRTTAANAGAMVRLGFDGPTQSLYDIRKNDYGEWVRQEQAYG